MDVSTGINIKHSLIFAEPKKKKTIKSLDERKWRLSYLKEQFESNQLHHLYEQFIRKVNYGYFSLFLIVQAVISITHFLVVVVSNYKPRENLIVVLPDLTFYLLTFILSAYGLISGDRKAEKSKKLYNAAILTFAVIFFHNIFLPIYHASALDKYRPSYSSYLILSCYIYFGTNRLSVCLIMGLMVTTFSLLTLILASYPNDEYLWQRVASDFIYLICFNGVGIYFRYLNEINARISFLDRRQFILSTYQLRDERAQVEELMRSIIPQYIIDKVKQNYIEATKHEASNSKHERLNPFDRSLLDEHTNVSILFADIVHYTEMTIKLNITDLLETLNELFSSFDDISEKLKVNRIKFLGDCYYCVSGLPPEPAKNHAEACVDLGLAMIRIIDNIRKKRNLNINMRIGVHSGNIISGVIGSVKYQFDIWSKDVDIANKMESEGIAGKVHITNKTKELLQKNYNLTYTRKGETVPQFKNLGLQTFLVSPDNEEENSYQVKPTVYNKKQKFGIMSHLRRNSQATELDENRLTEDVWSVPETYSDSINSNYKRRYNSQRPSRVEESRRSNSEVKRRTAFMNSNLKSFIERTHAVNEEMAKSIEEINFSKYHQYINRKQGVNLLLCLDNVNDECNYITKPDPLFKFYLVAALILVSCIYLLQNLTLGTWETNHVKNIRYGYTSGIIAFILIPISFVQFIWNKYYSNSGTDIPQNIILKFFYQLSEYITYSFPVRVIIYTVLYTLFVFCFLSEAALCGIQINERDAQNDTIFENSSRKYPGCVYPWQMTQSCILVLLMTFLFLRMFLWLKILYALVIIIIQIHGVLKYTGDYYVDSESYNFSVAPQVAHLLEVSLLTFTVHTLDRQTDYLNRLTYLLNKKVEEEQQEAGKLQSVNHNLLLNILPNHVANLYLDVSREMNDLYYEEHYDTAIMFASIITDDLQDVVNESAFLATMNEYIMAFDTVINRQQFKCVEKIKIAKWTYLAACGLLPAEKVNEYERCISQSKLETILLFVSEMFQKLMEVNKQAMQNCKLRVGICHGHILAGVVGSKKPLYDIWGDPVNMASRMDSTGLPNRIQVMEETADIISQLGYVCEYRGEILVKGKEGLTKTYFVKLDENFKLQKKLSRVSVLTVTEDLEKPKEIAEN